MRTLLLLWLLVAPLGATDANFAGHGFKASAFDGAGHLLRRLTADSATGPVDAVRLEKGQVEFFTAGSADHSIAVLDFAQALYRKADESIRGDGIVRLVSAQGTVSGRGYEYSLETGVLRLHAEIESSFADFHLAGQQAEIRIDPRGKAETGPIKEVTVTGGVTVQGTATAKVPFDRAETESARYNAEEDKLFLKSPLNVWRNGEKTVMEVAEGFHVIELNGRLKDAPTNPGRRSSAGAVAPSSAAAVQP